MVGYGAPAFGSFSLIDNVVNMRSQQIQAELYKAHNLPI